jgi:transposase
METSLVTCRTLDDFYHVDRRTFEKQYKEILSGYREWRDLDHADKWLLFPENIGPNVAIDESSLSNGELYTFVTNRDRHCGEGCLIAIVEGTKSEDVAEVLERIDESKRELVKEVTLDLSDSMRKIVSRAFPKAKRVIDRFHIQKLACDAVQEMRIRHRWDAIQKCNDEMEEAKLEGRDYVPERFPNGDTRKELLARSRYPHKRGLFRLEDEHRTVATFPIVVTTDMKLRTEPVGLFFRQMRLQLQTYHARFPVIRQFPNSATDIGIDHRPYFVFCLPDFIKLHSLFAMRTVAQNSVDQCQHQIFLISSASLCACAFALATIWASASESLRKA